METISKVYVTGDIHAGYTMKHLTSKKWNTKHLTKDDFLICLGDFGLPWDCVAKDDIKSIKSHSDVIISKQDLYHIKWFINKPYTILALMGNHEGIYSIWDKLEVRYFSRINGYIKVLPTIYGEIYYLLRDTEYTINNKRFLVVGGADSYDKAYRIPERTWWSMELLSLKEQSNILGIINKNNKFDFILSHTCPTFILNNLVSLSQIDKRNDPVAKFLNHIYSLIEFDSWHFGHLHTDEKVIIKDKVFQVHYKNKPTRLI